MRTRPARGSEARRASRHLVRRAARRARGHIRVPGGRADARRGAARTPRRPRSPVARDAAPRPAHLGGPQPRMARGGRAADRVAAAQARRLRDHRRTRPARPRLPADDEGPPQRTGFQVEYRGPDSDGHRTEIPHHRLFAIDKDQTLAAGSTASARARRRILNGLYVSSLRDIRRTYQRAFKALLFCRRLGLSAQAAAARDLRARLPARAAELFAGAGYYRTGRRVHAAYRPISTSTSCRCAITTIRRPRPGRAHRSLAAARPGDVRLVGAAASTTAWPARTYAPGKRAPAVASVRGGPRQAARPSRLPAAPPGRGRPPLAARPALLPGPERAGI